MRRGILFWLVTALLSLENVSALETVRPPVCPAPVAEWVTRSWWVEDGLPQNTVNAIVQTHDGFLWVGTNAGLARFDGVRFRKFGLQDGLRSVLITALAEDRAGALWIGSSGGGVSRWDKGRLTSFGAEEGFPAGTEVIALAADREGSVWIGTDKGLVQWKAGVFKTVGEAEGLPRKQVRALLEDSKGNLWVSVILEGLYRGADGRFTRVEAPGPVSGSVYSLMEDREGSIWAGADVVWKWTDGVWKRFGSDSGLPGAPVQSLAQSADGTVWAGLRGIGLYCSSGERFVPTGSGGPLSKHSISAITTDREGSVWVGVASEGLHRLSPRVLQYWDANAGLPTTAVTSVAEDPSGTLWVGTANGGMERFENGRFNPIVDPAVPATPPIIYCTAALDDGSIWAAGEQCLFRFQSGQPTKSYMDAPVKGEAIRALCADGDTMWLGTYYSTLLKCDAGGVHVVAQAGSLPGTITCMVREAADILWIGTSTGLHRWDHGRIQTWTKRDGLLTNSIRALHRDGDGTLWIGTLGGGMARMKKGRFINITTRQGLTDDVISQIVPDDIGGLWLGCNRGLMRIDRRELNALADGKVSELQVVALGRNEGMAREQASGGTSPTAFKARDGCLYFPLASGLAEIDPRRLQNLTAEVPDAIIEEIFVDHKPKAPGVPLVIPPGGRRLEINYTAPQLRGGEWVRFRHRLKGYDSDWTNAGSSRLAFYDSLPPGNYLFQVAAADSTGNWNEPGASLAFTVQPFLWETLWFRATGLMLLVGLSGSVGWAHLHRKHLVRMAELEHERKQQAALAHASRVSTAGQLSAALAHELNQPLGIILSNAQAAQHMLEQESPDLAELREILSDIVHEDRRAGEVIQRLRALLKKGEASFQPTSPNEIIQDVLRLLRSELIGRGVTVQTELATGLPDITGDQVQLQQVLLNIIINACDAMADLSPPERVVEIATQQHKGGVHISIMDQGCGLPKGNDAQVFQPFFTTKAQGMGIGLSICRSILAAHHGRLWATRNARRGATFHLELQIFEPPVV